MEPHGQLQELLKRAECFKDLGQDALALLEREMRLLSFEPGSVICAEGNQGNHMYVVKSGEVVVLKKGKAGPPAEVAVLRPGDFGGLLSLFLQEPRTVTLKARGPVELWALERAAFETLLDGSSALARALLASLSRQLHKMTIALARLQTFDASAALKVAVFDAKPYTRSIFTERNRYRYAVTFFDHRLNLDTAASAFGFGAVCAFVNDDLSGPVVERLHELGVRMIAMRCAGYNNVDLTTCARLGITVARVPAYSPQSVAEHGIALMMALNRRIFRAHARVREGNFSLDGLVGFEVHGKTVGLIGTGRIGKCAADIFLGFGCRVLAYDKFPDKELSQRAGVAYISLDELLRESDIISIYLPLMPETRHLIDAAAIAKMKPGVMLINTSRGGLVDTLALIDGLKSGQVGSAGLDVYEEESEYFFEDFSGSVITDDVLARLMTFNNVLITSHMAFLTQEALANIADTTFENIREFEQGKRGKELTYGVCPKCG